MRQSSPDVAVGIDEWVDTADLATRRSIFVIGSPAVNLFAYAVNSVLSAGFEEIDGGPMRIRLDSPKRQVRFPAMFQHDTPDRHYGLVLFDRSPVSPGHKTLWIAGISGMATQAAARFVRDLVATPANALERIRADRPNAVVVRPKWHAGFRAEQYQSAWRVSEYEVVWWGRLYDEV